MSDVADRLRTCLADRYRIERELGRGGMATVFLAHDIRHERRVALKVLDPELARSIGQDRFLREIRIAARLQHPHILPLHDSGDADGELYYVMPYIAGKSLRARMALAGPMPLDDALRFACEIASALGHAHHQGIVHRDIKPENVLLSDGIAMVADFGIARVLTASASESTATASMVLGTPLYMAPEQAAPGADVDGRADLYALSCVLYEMLAGAPPFTGSSAMAVIAAHAFQPVPSLRTRRPEVSEALEHVIAKGLGKTPAQRYRTAAHFVEALRMALGSSATSTATPESRRETIRNNLPKHRTSFVGRERELEECTRLLGETRMLMLIGIGGCGKTRLALKLAEGLLEAFPDGAWWADLSPLQDPDRVSLAVASALDVREEPDKPLIETLRRHLKHKHSLIVLDNCEHVLSACAKMADGLLAAGPNIKLLATSREALGVDGERPYAVRSLTVPERGAEHDVQAASSSEGVRLFVDRAVVVAPDFELTLDNTAAVAEICRRLDGVPLAIELAAARAKVLTVEQIRAKLDDRFRLLSGGSKALPRHRTLQAVIQWSYDQLSPEEQHLFRALSVFAGSFALAGATAMAGEHPDEFEVLDLIARLVDKSLINVERDLGGEASYNMLETVRQYAQERLDESGEGDEARTRHLAFYLAFAEEAEPKLTGPEQGEWFNRIDRELDNLLAAHAWCSHAQGGTELGLRLAGAVPRYWLVRGQFKLGMRVSTEALDRAGAQAATLARARVLYAAGVLALYLARHAEAEEYLRLSLSLAKALEAKPEVSAALRFLGATLNALGDRAAAEEYLEEAVRLAREIGDKRRLAAVLNEFGEFHRAEGNLPAAAEIYQESLALNREVGDSMNYANCLLNVARTCIAAGEFEQPPDLLREALGVAEEIDARWISAGALDASAGLALSRGDWERGVRLQGASEAEFGRMGYRREPADDRLMAPLISRARVALGEAAYVAGYTAGSTLSYEDAVVEARLSLGHAGPADS